MDGNTLYMGDGGFIFNGTSRVTIDGGYLTSLLGSVNITFNIGTPWGMILNTCIRDNGNIKTGLNITGGQGDVVHLGGNYSNTFTGEVNVKGNHLLSLEKDKGSIAVSGNMNVKDGAKVVSYRSGQIAKHVRVSLESSETNVPQLILENGVQESFRELNVDRKGIVEFKGSSKLILDELNVGVWDELTIVGWEHGKDLFLVRKTSTHVKGSLSQIIFQGQRGRVHLEDYNKDYWELTTAPEPATTGAVVAALGLTITACRKRRSPKLTY